MLRELLVFRGIEPSECVFSGWERDQHGPREIPFAFEEFRRLIRQGPDSPAFRPYMSRYAFFALARVVARAHQQGNRGI